MCTSGTLREPKIGINESLHTYTTTAFRHHNLYVDAKSTLTNDIYICIHGLGILS